MPQGKVADKREIESTKGRTYLLKIQKTDGTFFHKAVSRSTYTKTKLGKTWHYFERTNK